MNRRTLVFWAFAPLATLTTSAAREREQPREPEIPVAPPECPELGHSSEYSGPAFITGPEGVARLQNHVDELRDEAKRYEGTARGSAADCALYHVHEQLTALKSNPAMRWEGSSF